MVRLIFALLMVLDALMKVLYWSCGPYHMWMVIATEQVTTNAIFGCWIGQLGLAVFGLGVFGLSLSCRAALLKSRVPFSVASVCLILAVLAIGFGNAMLIATFFGRSPERAMELIGFGRIPLLIGWNLVLLGAVVSQFAVVANSRLDLAKRAVRKGAIVGAVSAIILTVAAIGSATSASGFEKAIGGVVDNPKLLGPPLIGAMSFSCLSLLGIIGCVFALYPLGMKEQTAVGKRDSAGPISKPAGRHRSENDMPEASDSLQSLIAAILDAEARGESVDRDIYLGQHPEHADSLREFFASHDSMKAGSHTEDVTLPPATNSFSAVEDPTLPPLMDRKEAPTLPPRIEKATLLPDGAPVQRMTSVGDSVHYFGDYELVEEIARGGMGVVYKARQINLNRIVALKMILSGQLAGEDDVKRFYTEAEAAASLDHPGIVPIFEVGQHQGQHYFSMGFIEGQSLAQRVVEGPLPPREAAELVTKICDAMTYAHERGVVHRDLKPANILIDQTGQPKVTDFGLAKQMNVDSGLTGTGQILGTPSYMAPEQASGKVDEVGPLADLYALGAILYCLLTGRPPFQAANPMDTLLQVLEQQPLPPRQLNAAVDTDMQTITLKCLEKDARLRYSNVDALAEELGRFLRGEPIKARPLSRPARVWRWCKRKPISASLMATAASLFLLLAVGGPTVAWQQSVLRQQANSQLVRAEGMLYASQIASAQRAWEAKRASLAWEYLDSCSEELRGWEHDYLYTTFSAHQQKLDLGPKQQSYSVAVNPNGKQFATGSRDGQLIIWNSTTRKIQFRLDKKGRSDSVTSIDFSPDGKKVVAAMNFDEIRVLDTSNGAELSKMRHRSVHTVRFDNEGGRVVSAGAGNATVRVWDASSGMVLHELDFEENLNLGTAEAVFSPDGSKVAATNVELVGAPRNKGSIRIWDASRGKLVQTLETPYLSRSVNYSPDGTRIASGGSQGEITVWEAATGAKLSALQAGRESINTLRFSPDSSVLGSTSGERIQLWDTSTWKKTRELVGHRGSLSDFSFLKGGERIVSAGGSTVRFWESKPQSELPVTLATDGYPVSDLAFSPDGSRLVTISFSGGIKVRDAETGSVVLANDYKGNILGMVGLGGVQFNASGKRIFYSSALCEIDAFSGDNVSPQAKGFGDKFCSRSAISPDGKTIAFLVVDDLAAENAEIQICDATTKSMMHKIGPLRQPAMDLQFSPRRNQIVVSHPGENAESFSVWDTNSGQKILAFGSQEDRSLDFALTPDGQAIVAATGQGLIVWDLATGRKLRTMSNGAETFRSFAGAADRVMVSPDGSRVLSCEREGTIRLWNLATGQPTSTIDEPAVCAAFSADGKRIATTDKNGNIKIWDASMTYEPRK